MEHTTTLLGEGQLNWSRYERIGDRYGTVMLFADHGERKELEDYAAGDKVVTDFADAPVGQTGSLKVEIVENRESGHIGDIFHGLVPGNSPKPGEIVELGHGELFRDTDDAEYPAIGVRPDRPFDGVEGDPLPADRETFWLDPVMLYRVHEQIVRLLFDPDNPTKED